MLYLGIFKLKFEKKTNSYLKLARLVYTISFKTRFSKIGQEMPCFLIFSQEFDKSIVIFEISTLEFAETRSFVQK